jgi:phosphatidylserine/phosphatidylglycerophosphate/cardiolipin synthase-like enzyme
VVPLEADVAPNSENTLRDPYDPVNPDWKRWFYDGACDGGNEVVGYIRPHKYFRDAASAIRSATAPGHFIAIAAWGLFIDDPPLIGSDASSTLRELLTAADARGVAVRALLWPGVDVAIPIVGARFGAGFPAEAQDASEFINALPNGYAILDDRHLPVGAHHQKMLIVNGSEGLVAFQGGVDITPHRLNHRHDVQTRLRGPAAARLETTFYQRYVDYPAANKKPLWRGAASRNLLPKHDLHVKTVRTYGNPTKHGFANGQPGAYGWAPNGETDVRRLIVHAIGQARRFIYIEDQYLVDPGIGMELARALPHLELLVILIPSSTDVQRELRIPRRKRLEFLNPLFAIGPGKVFVYTGGDEFIHAKVWVFDDLFAIVGSANVNRRGMTHDSEVACGIYDTNVERRWYFAHELRMNLWAKHLHCPPLAFADPLGGIELWKRLSHRGGPTEPYDRNEALRPDPGQSPFEEAIWSQYIDPAGD